MTLREHLRNEFDDHNPLPLWPLVTRKTLDRAEREAFEIGGEHERRQRA